jgi:hypothetical protein
MVRLNRFCKNTSGDLGRQVKFVEEIILEVQLAGV